MNPDRAHRTANSVLLLIIMMLVMVSAEPTQADLWDHLYAVGVYGSILAIFVAGLLILNKRMDEVRQYFGVEADT